MIIKLYKQMTEILVHAEKKCRKILHPDWDYSPTVQMWYDRIHAYPQLIRMEDGKAKNIGNIIHLARCTNVKGPDKLTMEEPKDSIWYCRIQKLNSKSK